VSRLCLSESPNVVARMLRWISRFALDGRDQILGA
jgi:hypothetical protein